MLMLMMLTAKIFSCASYFFARRLPFVSICGAHSSFCGDLKAVRIKIKPGDPILDDIIDTLVTPKMGKSQIIQVSKECDMQLPDFVKTKKRKKNLMLGGGGQCSFSISASSKMLFKRDYPSLATFDGTQKMGVITVPSAIIPAKGYRVLYREKLEDAIRIASLNQEYQGLAKELNKALEADVGDIPEEDAYHALKEAFNDSQW